tara:strand:- start:1789 stop:1962 length:174 start_codon:yes stop_codon:yes gene_type:complete
MFAAGHLSMQSWWHCPIAAWPEVPKLPLLIPSCRYPHDAVLGRDGLSQDLQQENPIY